jgi:hypothetical protein
MCSVPKQSASFIAPDIKFTSSDLTDARLRLCSQIAKRLLQQLLNEVQQHGLLRDYIGFPYRSPACESAWDFQLEPGSQRFVYLNQEASDQNFVVGRHKELWKESLILLKRDLIARGFVVRRLRFQEELIRFGDGTQARGIGLEWSLVCQA